MDSDPKFEALRRVWYTNQSILYNIIECLKYRECVFIAKGKGVIRCVKANAIRFLQMNFERYHFLEHPMNLYGSLSLFPSMPMFSFSRQEKRKEQDDFNIEYKQYLKGYDFLMDIDNPNIKSALRTLMTSQEHFQGIPYYVLFSGTKGMHLKVDYEDMPQEFKDMPIPDLCDLFKRFAENFSLINNLPDVDYSIYDLRRIAKTPYSVVYPYYFIALPMSDEQITNFDLKEYSIKTQIQKIPELRNRGLLKRPGTGEAFAKLINKYGDVN